MRVKTINQFNQKNLLIGIAPTVEIKDPPQGSANPKASNSKPKDDKKKDGNKKNNGK